MQTETIDKKLSLEEAAEEVARITDRTPPHASTVGRWANAGVRGVRLRVVRIGGRVFTTREHVEAFLKELNVDESDR